jgi:hypothetical protein
MDPAAEWIKSGLKVRDDPVLLPVAVAGGFWALLAALLRRERLLRGLCRPARFGLGFGPFAGLADSGGDFFGG